MVPCFLSLSVLPAEDTSKHWSSFDAGSQSGTEVSTVLSCPVLGREAIAMQQLPHYLRFQASPCLLLQPADPAHLWWCGRDGRTGWFGEVRYWAKVG
jgi:hypothetical protein